MTRLPALEICTGKNPDASIIWLHGLGADGYDFAPVVEEFRLSHVRFVLPHAPRRPITINGGYVMPAWYDVFGTDREEKQDEAGIRASQALIEELIAWEQERGTAPHRIALAGFSQGGAIALHTGLRHKENLAGIIALSTYLPLQESLAGEEGPASLCTPIFMAHGVYDDIIPVKAGRDSRNFLATRGYQVAWHEYPMPHSVCVEEIKAIRDYIEEILAPS